MAVTIVPKSTTLCIEVQSGVDKAGDPIYSKKSFSGIRNDVDSQNAYEVMEAIKVILDASTRDIFINTASSLINA